MGLNGRFNAVLALVTRRFSYKSKNKLKIFPFLLVVSEKFSDICKTKQREYSRNKNKNIEIMETYKRNIADRLINNEIHNNRTLENIDEAIQYAWNNWDADIVSTYYTGQKPALPNAEFIENWIDNEDFDADGDDVEYLKEQFS